MKAESFRRIHFIIAHESKLSPFASSIASLLGHHGNPPERILRLSVAESIGRATARPSSVAPEESSQTCPPSPRASPLKLALEYAWLF